MITIKGVYDREMYETWYRMTAMLESDLALADHPDVRAAAHAALDQWGFGMASVRFICGTQSIHRVLEHKLSEFLGTEDTVLYNACCVRLQSTQFM
jgi:7-keto-8-aminopelargonate synthetase-like enzyme